VSAKPTSVPAGTSGLGGWLFRHRTALPVPIAIAILALPSSQTPAESATVLGGVLLTLAGEALRLWGVRHIGVISRTRSERLGPLVASGPFALVRNPLYIGNIALWVGFALTARLVWLAPLVFVLLAAEYHAIVRWEEGLLEARLGNAYRDYVARVPRWLPKSNHRDHRARRANPLSAVSVSSVVAFSWGDTFFSERGTLIAIAVGYVLLWLKARF
jgi:protein-S-isoprenylcysteine O-methyltransferase Ste14